MDPSATVPAAPGVELRGIAKRYGGVPAVRGISLAVPQGSFVSLLGPSGCGKTTTLRMIAGLETPDEGEILIRGEAVFARSGRVDVAPARRKVGFVFQSFALWPHMTVFDNLAYPLRRAGHDAAAVRAKVGATLELLKATALERRYPGELSGGQQQRIALGRAIINPDNRVVLFDEPLSNLDAKLREDLRMELRGLQQDLGFTAIYVTHDQAEALSMSDHVVIMRDGRIERQGDPESVFSDPRSRYVAHFLGAHNIVTGSLRTVAEKRFTAATPLGELDGLVAGGVVPVAGATVEVALPTDGIRLAAERESPQDFEGVVTAVAYYGSYADIALSVGGLSLRCRVPAGRRWQRGMLAYGHVMAHGVLLTG